MEIPGKVYYPIQFSTNKIFYHPEFEEELRNLLCRSGFEGKFKQLFRNRMRFLDERMERCTLKSDWFEKLRNADDLFAMRFNKQSKNIRIIFMFTDSSQKKITILLCGFEEKGSKDYQKAIDLATKRKADVLNGFHIEEEREDKKDG
ncbi:MAG: hypothetical protein GX154_12135 [Clostridiales bacterium]|nr:hypothetical protein [Clostridiales bacterium]